MGKIYQGLSSGERKRLAEAVPLEKPICIRISPTTACNLRCEYCSHALPDSDRWYTVRHMPFGLFRDVIDDVKQSFGQVKKVFLVGEGEPLLNPAIISMVDYLSRQKVCDTFEIITNGLLLDSDLSDGLCAAGLPRLKISINGLSAEEYKKNCGVEVDFDRMLQNLEYLYKHRGNTKILLKIMDYMVQDNSRKEHFFRLFSSLCDEITIENLIVGNHKIDFTRIGGENFIMSSTMCNVKLSDAKICAMPFYMMLIDENGLVSPCCVSRRPIVGDVSNKSLSEIWRGEELRKFQCAFLKRGKSADPICTECKTMQYYIYPEDNIDTVREQLLETLSLQSSSERKEVRLDEKSI